MSFDRSAKFATIALAFVALLAAAPKAHAAPDSVDPMGKGLVGLMLLSGELVLSIEALAGVKNPWALAIPTIVAAAGGAVGGYFIDAKVQNAGVSVGLLVGGMALFFPAIIIAVAKTRFVSEKDLAEDVNVTVSTDDEEAPPAEPEPDVESAMIHVTPEGVSVGAPLLEVVGLYSDEEMQFLAHKQGVEYRLPVLDVAF